MTRNSIQTRHHRSALACAAIAALCSPSAWAGGEQVLEKVTVTGTATNLIGVADSANVGTVTQKQLEARTVYRPGELLEAAPGLVVSQHSGEEQAVQQGDTARRHEIGDVRRFARIGDKIIAAPCRPQGRHHNPRAQSIGVGFYRCAGPRRSRQPVKRLPVFCQCCAIDIEPERSGRQAVSHRGSSRAAVRCSAPRLRQPAPRR